MIKFLLTGATSPNGFQNNPAFSLGGYVSVVNVNNGEVDTLFGGISSYSSSNIKPEYILIAIRNENKIKTGVSISVVNPNTNLCTVDIGVVKPTLDNDGNIVFERIANRFAAPFYVDFAGGSAIQVPNLAVGDTYGIWIKRTTKQPVPIPTDAELISAFDTGQPLPQSEGFSIKIDYTE